MTVEEVVNSWVAQVRRANEDALLCSRAFVLGEFDTYWQANIDQVKRDIEERHAAARPDTG